MEINCMNPLPINWLLSSPTQCGARLLMSFLAWKHGGPTCEDFTLDLVSNVSSILRQSLDLSPRLVVSREASLMVWTNNSDNRDQIDYYQSHGNHAQSMSFRR